MKSCIPFALIIIVLLSACSNNKQEVELKRTNLEELSDLYDPLLFEFDTDVFSDSLPQAQLEYFSFEPAIQGRFQWKNAKQLLFYPLNGLKPFTSYEAKLERDAFKKQGVMTKDWHQTFETQSVLLEDARVFWDFTGEDGKLMAVLSFNYQMKPEQLSALIEMYNGTTKLKWEMLTNKKSTEFYFKIPEAWEGDISRKYPLNVLVNPGLGCVECGLKTSDPISRKIDIPYPGRMEVVDVKTLFEDGMGTIIVNTSTPVGNKEPDKLIKISPWVPFTVVKNASGLTISGNFLANTRYNFELSDKLQSASGEKLQRTYNDDLVFQASAPYIRFHDHDALYLPSKGNKKLAVQMISINEVRLQVFKVFANNLMDYFRTGRDWDYRYENGQYHGYEEYPQNQYAGMKIVDTKINVSQLEHEGQNYYLEVADSLLQHQRDFKGMYVISLSHPEKSWIQDDVALSCSDLGLIARCGTNSLSVFVRSIKTAEPVSKVVVTVISKSNQEVFRGGTDDKGMMKIHNLKEAMGDFQPAMIIAESASDINYLIFDESAVPMSRFEEGGRRVGAYDAFVSAPRNIYRPGDTLDYQIVVRDKSWNVADKLPLELKIMAPDGRKYKSLRHVTGDQGVVSGNLALPHTLPTGGWYLDVYSGSGLLLNSWKFQIESFVPDRISVSAKLNADVFYSGDALILDGTALNLFGPPAADRNYDLQLELNPKQFRAKNYPDYIFGPENQSPFYLQDNYRQGKTAADGTYSQVWELPKETNKGQFEGRLFLTVFDENGRPVYNNTSFTFYTQKTFYGLRLPAYWTGTRQPFNFKAIAVDVDGKELKTSANVKIYRIYYETVMQQTYSGYRYSSEKRSELLVDQKIEMNGVHDLSFTPTKSGSYSVEIEPKDGGSPTISTFYAYGWADTDYSSFAIDKDGLIEISTDKEDYECGDVARLLFSAPFDGKMLVTIERDNVIDHYNLELKDKTAELKLPLDEGFLPNIFISATAFQPLDEQNMPITVAHGYKMLKISDPGRKIAINIDAVEKSRSGRSQTVKLKTKAGAKVWLYAVDEGILQLTRYKSPNPFNWFYAPRALQVNAFDLYARLFPVAGKMLQASGGGFDTQLAKHLNPFGKKDFQLVSYTFEPQTADSKGRVEFKLNIPDFSGKIRLMAVAADGNKFGSESQYMTVADPLVISIGDPMFLSFGDKLDMAVNLTNTTDKSMTAELSAESGSLLAMDGMDDKIVIGPNSEKALTLRITAGKIPGDAHILFKVRANGELFEKAVQIPIRPTAPKTYTFRGGTVAEGAEENIEMDDDYIAATAERSIKVTAEFSAAFAQRLEQLIDYPYGCLEQTVSRAFPLLYYREMAKMTSFAGENDYNPDYVISTAIDKVYSMQKPDGGMSYWPGGDRINYWSNIYAAHFLTEAGKNGFSSDPAKMKKLLSYIRKMLKVQHAGIDAQQEYNVSDGRKFISDQIPYALYVLALNHQPEISMMNYYKNRLHLMRSSGQSLIAAAFAAIGDASEFRQMQLEINEEFMNPDAEDKTFGSYTRNLALSLMAQIETDDASASVAALAYKLISVLDQKQYLSTQELAFSFLALGKLSKTLHPEKAKAEIMIDGKTKKMDDGSFAQSGLAKGQEITIKNTGGSDLFYFCQSSGISSKPIDESVFSGLILKRRYYDREGRELDPAALRPGMLVVVLLELRTDGRRWVENVALTEMIPACFQVENPRVTAQAGLKWLQPYECVSAEHADIRDDRIIYFLDARVKNQYLSYMARVISAGEFTAGAASAEAMYEGSVYAHTPAIKIISK